MIQKKIVLRFLAASIATSLLMACSESYPGLEYDLTQGNGTIENQDSWSEKTPIKVFVNEQDIFIVKDNGTRGMGAFDSNDTTNLARLNNATFYALAFRDGQYTQGSIDELKNPTDFRWWSHEDSNGPRSFSDYMVNNNCLLDGPDYNLGLPMYLLPEGAGMLHTARDVTEEVDEYYYSPVNQQVPYNFFAYYLDDIQPTKVNRTEESFSYDIEIDGSQDLMCGAAPNLIDEIRNGNLGNKWNFLSADEKRTIENIGGYCTFTANRGIHPEVKMVHLLTRLSFELYPADESANEIEIDSVNVESRYKGNLTVAARSIDNIGIEWDDERQPLYLLDAYDGKSKCSPLTPQTVTFDPVIKENGGSWYDQPHKVIGSSLMLAPDTEYVLRLSCKQTYPINLKDPSQTKDWIFHPQYTLKLTSGEKFEAGHEYTIKIAVYGLHKIEISIVSVPKWERGEDIELDDYDDE